MTLKIESSFQSATLPYVLRYTATNQSSADILLFNQLYVLEEGKAVVKPGLAYTLVEGHALVLVRAVMPIPPGIQVEIPDMPYAMRLEPGKKITEELSLPDPIPFYNPHAFPTKDETLQLQEVRLRLGWAPFTGHQPPPEKTAPDKNLYRLPYRVGLRAQKTADSNTYKTAVNVKVTA